MHLEEDSGMVLVLLPGGAFPIGAREDDPGRMSIEQLHVVTLKPFFISKYETTQAQWIRIMGQNPSGTVAGKPATGTHPLAEKLGAVNCITKCLERLE